MSEQGAGLAWRTPLLAVGGWLVAVVMGGWLSWTAIDAAGRQVVVPVVPDPSSALGPAPSSTGPSPSSAAPTPSGPATATTSPATDPTSPGTPAPGPTVRTVTTRGGSAGVSCSGSEVTVTYALAATGWRAEVEQEGFERARVDFERDDERVEVRAACSGGQPTASVEDERTSSGPGGDDDGRPGRGGDD